MEPKFFERDIHFTCHGDTMVTVGRHYIDIGGLYVPVSERDCMMVKCRLAVAELDRRLKLARDNCKDNARPENAR